jgi:hypothetical protein
MVSSRVTSEEIMSAVQQVPMERWGELLRVIESLHPIEETSEASKLSIRTGADLAGSDLIGIWGNRTDLGDSQQFAQGLRRQAEQRTR